MNAKALIEAALFVSNKPLSLKKLSRLAGIDESEVYRILKEIERELEREDRGIELAETPEGFEFRIKGEYVEKVASLAPLADLSDGMVRTLSIVVLNQPVKQSDIVKFQGNKAYGYIKALERKGLIKAEKQGRTRIITLTHEFERYFGKDVEEIKKELEKRLACEGKEGIETQNNLRAPESK